MGTNHQPQQNFHGDKNYYLGNKHLPTDRSEFQWTPEMVGDLKKSKKNFQHIFKLPTLALTKSGKKGISSQPF